jgi:hypothetical protein
LSVDENTFRFAGYPGARSALLRPRIKGPIGLRSASSIPRRAACGRLLLPSSSRSCAWSTCVCMTSCPAEEARLHRVAEETAQLFRPSGQLPRLHDDNCFIIVKAQSCARVPFIEGSIQQFNNLCMATCDHFLCRLLQSLRPSARKRRHFRCNPEGLVPATACLAGSRGRFAGPPIRPANSAC